MITFETGQSSYGLSGFSQNAYFFPVFMLKGKRKSFVYNLKSSRNLITAASNISEVQSITENLAKNNGRFVRFYGWKESPLEFLKWVKERKATLEVHTKLFHESEGFTDFCGNLCELSAAFRYRIYDKRLLNQIKAIVEPMKKR